VASLVVCCPLMGGSQRHPVFVRPKEATGPGVFQRTNPRRDTTFAADCHPESLVPSRTGFDFRSMRIVSNSAEATVDQPAVLAATVGDEVHLSPVLSVLPADSRRKVLAHELVHVAQQHNNNDGPAADEEALEREADREAMNLVAGREIDVRMHASAAAPHYKRVKHGGKEYEVGDVVLNDAAQTDVFVNGNLTPADNAHLFQDGKNLGYDIAYKDPQDPFRWSQIKSIVDTEHININGVGVADAFNASLVEPPNPAKTVQITLMQLKAGGLTLPTLSRAQAIQPGAIKYTGSVDPKRDEIYYESGKGGKGSREKSSLAHELFGHFGLARQGAAWEHGVGAMIAASPQVSDPFGQPIVGKVDEYIEKFADDRQRAIFTSPTQFVSPAFLKQSLKDLAANRGKGLKREKDGGILISAGWRTIWLRLSQNYRLLDVMPKAAIAPPQTGSGATPAPVASPVPTKSDVETAVLTWFGGLSAEEQGVFQQYVSDAPLKTTSEPTELGLAVLKQLPKP